MRSNTWIYEIIREKLRVKFEKVEDGKSTRRKANRRVGDMRGRKVKKASNSEMAVAAHREYGDCWRLWSDKSWSILIGILISEPPFSPNFFALLQNRQRRRKADGDQHNLFDFYLVFIFWGPHPTEKYTCGPSLYCWLIIQVQLLCYEQLVARCTIICPQTF